MNFNRIKSKSNSKGNNNKKLKTKDNIPNLNDKYNPYSIYWANDFLKRNKYCIGINYNDRIAIPYLRAFIRPTKHLQKSKTLRKINLTKKIYNLYL